MNVYSVILAGGKGERLWPLSTQTTPKQLLPFDQGKSLLEKTIERVQTFIDAQRIWIVTTEQQKPLIEQTVGALIGHIVTEPSARNTAPALLLTCLKIHESDPDSLVVFLPADHCIPDTDMFVTALKKCITATQENSRICLLGLKPEYPATGYGYIEYNASKQEPYLIKRFHEKPDAQTAQSYYQQPTMLWNLGIFCAPTSVFIQDFKKYTPQLFDGMTRYLKSNNAQDYALLDSCSFDNAIMEKTDNSYVIPAHFEWSDVGTLTTFLQLQNNNYCTNTQNIIAIKSKNNSVAVPHKIVALLGVEDLCIVETADVLLITKISMIEQVKQLAEQCSLRNAQKITVKKGSS